jgi:uncharacterized protein (TIGR02145 family)
MNKIFSLVLISCIVLLSWGCEDAINEGDTWALIYPDVMEALVKGVTYNILCKAPSNSLLRIELFWNSQYYTTIAEGIYSTEVYKWNIPDDIAAGSDYTIQISDMHDLGLQTMSKNSFRILDAGILSTYTDLRDGQTYRTVQLGEQIWMAENYKYYPVEGSRCYLNDTAFCETLGRLYTQQAAISNPPDGWHLPSDEEWKELELYLGMAPEEIDLFGNRGHAVGDILRPDGGSGFHAIFSGYYNHCAGKYGHKSYESHYWTSSINGDGKPILRIIGNEGDIGRLASTCHMGSSARYLKD